MEDLRIGVYVCNCGTNIAKVVDCDAVVEAATALPGVAVARPYKYMCSNPGQEMIVQDIQEHGLNRVVVAACSPRMHEPTFRKALGKAGLNPYFLEMANIREQCSWVHDDPVEATEKAKALIRAAVMRVAHHEPLERRSVDMCPRHAGDRRRHRRHDRGPRAGRRRASRSTWSSGATTWAATSPAST